MDPRKRGHADFHNGKKLEHNPYRSVKEGKRAWTKGWHEAREGKAVEDSFDRHNKVPRQRF